MILAIALLVLPLILFSAYLYNLLTEVENDLSRHRAKLAEKQRIALRDYIDRK